MIFTKPTKWWKAPSTERKLPQRIKHKAKALHEKLIKAPNLGLKRE